MNPAPLVSIIIPTYNRAHLIGETLDSVLAQTYTNWECIVVDDGSTDCTDELLAEYCKKDARFQYHHRPKNRPKGANACRNYGFELSKGEYINWFDSDDLMLPDKLKIQVKELYNSSYDYTICQTMMYDIEKDIELGLRAPKLTSKNIFEDYILFKIFWLTGAPLWKKTFLIENKLQFDEKLQQGQDYDFHIRVLVISQNYFQNKEPLVFFNIHQNNMSLSMVDTKEKVYSNSKIIYNIIVYYNKSITKGVILVKFKELINYYREAVRNKQRKNSIIIFGYIIRIMFIGKISFMNYGNLIFKSFLALIYPYLGVGFKFTKLKFNYGE